MCRNLDGFGRVAVQADGIYPRGDVFAAFGDDGPCTDHLNHARGGARRVVDHGAGQAAIHQSGIVVIGAIRENLAGRLAAKLLHGVLLRGTREHHDRDIGGDGEGCAIAGERHGLVFGGHVGHGSVKFEVMQADLDSLSSRVTQMESDISEIKTIEQELARLTSENSKLNRSEIELKETFEKRKELHQNFKKSYPDQIRLLDRVSSLDIKISSQVINFEKQKTEIENLSKKVFRQVIQKNEVAKNIAQNKKEKESLEKWLERNSVFHDLPLVLSEIFISRFYNFFFSIFT